MEPDERAGVRLGERLLHTAAGREIAQHDWSGSSLGDIESWPKPLITLISTVMACPVPMAVAWGDELMCFFNDTYRTAVLGGHRDLALGTPLRVLWDGVWPEVEELVEAALQGESCRVDDKRMRWSGVEDERWWRFALSPVFDDDGAIAGLLWVADEATDGVLRDRKRRAASKRLHSALAAGFPIGSWDWDVVNDRVYADSQFALIYSVEPERARAGVPVDEFLACVHPGDIARVRSEIERALQTATPLISEYRILTRTGEHWVSAQGMPEIDANGRVVRFPGLSFDISANRKAEAEV